MSVTAAKLCPHRIPTDGYCSRCEAERLLRQAAKPKAADSLGDLVALDAQVDAAEGEGLFARWEFGLKLLARRVGKQLPKGLLDELTEATGKSRAELQRRAQFAERYPTREEVSHVCGTFKSWHDIVAQVLPSTGQHEPVAPPPLPVGVWNLLYVDPPWRYEDATPNRAVENHYPTMTVEELCALEVPAADDAVLFMWATAPKLIEALAVFEAWEFEYRTNAVWVKDKIGMGYYVRGRHEHLLIGRRGKLGVPEPANRRDSVIEAPRGRHSAKPDAAYELIEVAYPDARRLELFARSDRDGWDSWGHDAEVAA